MGLVNFISLIVEMGGGGGERESVCVCKQHVTRESALFQNVHKRGSTRESSTIAADVCKCGSAREASSVLSSPLSSTLTTKLLNDSPLSQNDIRC